MKKSAGYFLVFIAIQFVSLTLANGAILLKGGRPEDSVASAAVGMTAASFVLSLAVYAGWLKSIAISFDYLKSKPFLQLLTCIILGFAAIPLSLFVQDILPSLEDNNEELFKEMIASPMGFASLVLLGPVTEEIVFRGSILKALASSAGTWKAILLSSLAFAIIHFNPAQFVHAFAMGVMLGWISLRAKSIVPCIVIHMVNNCTAFLFIRYMPEASLTSAPMLLASALLVTISLSAMSKITARQ